MSVPLPKQKGQHHPFFQTQVFYFYFIIDNELTVFRVLPERCYFGNEGKIFFPEIRTFLKKRIILQYRVSKNNCQSAFVLLPSPKNAYSKHERKISDEMQSMTNVLSYFFILRFNIADLTLTQPFRFYRHLYRTLFMGLGGYSP